MKKITCNHNTLNVNNRIICGDYNSITGNNNEFSGDYNSITGNNNEINGDHNSITGNNNEINGDYNTSIGNNNEVSGDYNDTNGNNNKSSKSTHSSKFNFTGATFGTGNQFVRQFTNRVPNNNNNYNSTVGNFMGSVDSIYGKTYISSLVDGNLTATKIAIMGRGCAVFAENGNTSSLNIGDNNFTFKVNNGILTLITDSGTFKNDIDDRVLKRVGDNAITKNLYVHKKLQNETWYKCIDNEKFELIVQNNKVMCKDFKNFPKIIVGKRKRDIKKSPQRKPKKMKEGSSDDTVCKICYENEINTFILDCKHSCVCSDCAKKLKQCPVCRKFIVKGIDDMYLTK